MDFSPLNNAIRPLKLALLPLKNALKPNGDIITDSMSLVRAFHCKNTNFTVSDDTIRKLNDKFNGLLCRVENSYNYEYLASDLKVVKKSLESRNWSPAKRDLLQLAGAFDQALSRAQPSQPAPVVVMMHSAARSAEAAYALQAGYVPDRVKANAPSLSDAFGSVIQQRPERKDMYDATQTLRDVFARAYGFSDSSGATFEFKRHEFASIYRPDFKNLPEISSELRAILALVRQGGHYTAKPYLLTEVDTYRMRVDIAERFWKNEFAYHAGRDLIQRSAYEISKDEEGVREAATWLGWSEKRIFEEKEKVAKRLQAAPQSTLLR